MKDFLVSLTPPLIMNAYNRMRYKADRSALFEGHSSLFLKHAGDAHSYLEYGSGQSTLWMDRNRSAISVTSVESDKAFARTISTKLRSETNVTLLTPNLGPTGNWGYPVNYSRRADFPTYYLDPWRIAADADLILIDGRFRIACFAATLLSASPGAKIIFDDFHRPHYAVARELLEPVEFTGRQGLFEVPRNVDKKSAERLLKEFAIVTN